MKTKHIVCKGLYRNRVWIRQAEVYRESLKILMQIIAMAISGLPLSASSGSVQATALLSSSIWLLSKYWQPSTLKNIETPSFWTFGKRLIQCCTLENCFNLNRHYLRHISECSGHTFDSSKRNIDIMQSANSKVLRTINGAFCYIRNENNQREPNIRVVKEEII